MIRDNSLPQIIQEARAGIPASRDALARLVQERLGGYIFRHVGNPDVLQDVMQEVQLALVQSLGQLQNLECFWPWVYRVAASKIQQHYRTQRRRQVFLEHLQATVPLQEENHPGLLDDLIAQERIGRLRQAIGTLPEPQREVIRLRGLEELSYHSIAARTASCPQQARVRYFRARQALKTNLTLDR